MGDQARPVCQVCVFALHERLIWIGKVLLQWDDVIQGSQQSPAMLGQQPGNVATANLALQRSLAQCTF